MARVFIDSWGWTSDFYIDAKKTDNEEKLSLYQLFLNVNDATRDNRDYALQTLDHAVQLAQKLGELHWEIAFEFLQLYLNTKNLDLKRINVLLIKSSKAPYNTCPMVNEIYVFAIEQYIDADAIGYKERIEGAIEFVLSGGIPLNRENYGKALYSKAYLKYELSQYSKALAIVSDSIGIFEDNYKWVALAYLLKIRINYCLEQPQKALDCAIEMEKVSQLANEAVLVHTALWWQRLLLVRIGKRHETRPIRVKIFHLEKESPINLVTDESLIPEAELYDFYGGFWWEFLSIGVRIDILRSVLQQKGSTFLHCKAYLRLIKAMICASPIIRFLIIKFMRFDTLDATIEQAKEVSVVLADSNHFIMQLETILRNGRSNQSSPFQRGEYLQP